MPDNIPPKPPTPNGYQQPQDIAPPQQPASDTLEAMLQGTAVGDGWDNTNQTGTGGGAGGWAASNPGAGGGPDW